MFSMCCLPPFLHKTSYNNLTPFRHQDFLPYPYGDNLLSLHHLTRKNKYVMTPSQWIGLFSHQQTFEK